MTIEEAKNFLFEWFLSTDVFITDKNIHSDNLKSEEGKKVTAAFNLALKDMEEFGLVKHEYMGVLEGNYWILTHPVGDLRQTVNISTFTGMRISRLINDILIDKNPEQFKGMECDYWNIQESDINTLLLILELGGNNPENKSSVDSE